MLELGYRRLCDAEASCELSLREAGAPPRVGHEEAGTRYVAVDR